MAGRPADPRRDPEHHHRPGAHGRPRRRQRPRSRIMIGDEPPLKPLIDIPRMAEIRGEMLRGQPAGLRQPGRGAAAMPIASRDDEVDQLYNQVYRELLTFMMADPSTINRATHLLWVAHNLERIADRVTNICERVRLPRHRQDGRNPDRLRPYHRRRRLMPTTAATARTASNPPARTPQSPRCARRSGAITCLWGPAPGLLAVGAPGSAGLR